jgi:tetratricopeptide (TPR) repeat protein
MAGPTRRTWPTAPRWWDELGNWVERRQEQRADSPTQRLELAESRLARNLDKRGPRSWRTINAMEAVAKYREALGRHADALTLRQQVVEGRRGELGSEHELTLAAEARLAVTLIELKRADEAKPLLVHVHAGLTRTKGPEDPTVLAVTERLADAELALGESEDARRLLEQVRERYDQRGDEVFGSAVAITLAKSLIGDGRYAEASELLRGAVEVRGRLLGPDDPETLVALRNLASALVWSKEYAEASIVARNVLAATVRTHGSEDAKTMDAERLVRDIDNRLGEW